MIENNVSLDLMEFVETQILPRYSAFDTAHRIAHVNEVIKSSLELARTLGADVNMAYAIAAYHDLGLEGPRAVHHLTSGKILMADRRLLKWFTPSQITVMKEAVEDHRASASHAPRSIYGKIVAEADRNLDPETVIRRTIEYGRAHYPEKSKEEQWVRFMEHMNEKYSTNGYIKLWLSGSANEKKLAQLRDYISQPDVMRQIFDKIFNEIVQKG